MSEEKPEQSPKIHVDDDWKAQARAEKERLAAEQAAKSAQPAGAAGPAAATAGRPRAEAPEQGGLPEPTFANHVAAMASQALLALGAVPDPQTGRRYLDLELAKYYIDTLRMLEQKSTGNLSEDEKAQMDNALYQLRSAYIQAASAGNII